jgi:hypothetical protein
LTIFPILRKILNSGAKQVGKLCFAFFSAESVLAKSVGCSKITLRIAAPIVVGVVLNGGKDSIVGPLRPHSHIDARADD